jgi:uncharacterized membrane protein (DUF485 family)
MRVKEEQELKGTFKDLIKIRRHFINLLLMIFIWMASSFDMYLITFQMKYLPGSIFVNTLVSSAVDIPISIVSGILYSKFGVRITLPIFYVISLAGSISLVYVGDGANLGTFIPPLLVMLARCGVKVTLDLCYLANSSIFPAIFAGTAFGLCNLGAKLFTILSPIMAEQEMPLPMLVFSVLAGLAIVAALSIRSEPKSKEANI